MRMRPWLLAGAIACAGCVPRPEMCSQRECGAESSCVAGRCVAHGAVVAIATARRVLFEPEDQACVRCEGPQGASAAIGRLGNAAGGVLLLRFSIDLPPEATVVEAYLVLERLAGDEPETGDVTLHAARITERWDGASVTWPRLPAIVDVHAPATHVYEATGPRVRLDVRDLVERWRRRQRDELGVAVVGSGASARGIAFAMRPLPGADHGPQLELYVK